MGFKNIPTPEKCNTEELNNDVNEFFRRMRLKEFFHDIENNDNSIVRNNSNFEPPCGRNISLDSYISASKAICSNTIGTNNHTKYNITLKQREAIKSLAHDNSIIIKEADKGGGIVIMNTEFYKTKVLEMLSDANYYKPIPGSNQLQIFNKIKTLTTENRRMTRNEINFLLKFECKTSTFYGLPKIHKSQIITNSCSENSSEYIEIPDPIDLTLRPIVAGLYCETSRLSSFLDTLLKPYLLKVHSYLRDNIDFLNFIPKNVPLHTKLVSFDIVSLYTTIPHNLGLESISFWLNKHPELLAERFSIRFVVRGLQIILENNNFSFNKSFYNQTKGTAMGTKVAPTYATLVLGFLEEKLYRIVEHQKGHIFANFVRDQWRRYLDDCSIFWQRSMDDLVYFCRTLNSLHNDIVFKMQTSEYQLPILDVMVIKSNTSISTDIYFKSTDSKQYLNFKSCHPKHTKVNIPFSLARRICTIVSDISVRNVRLKELASSLIDRKYPIQVVKTGFFEA